MADPIDQVISLRADTSKLDGDLAAAKAKAEAGTAGADAALKATAATNAQTAATSRLGDELRKVKKTYGEQIQVVQGLIGKVMAVGAVAGTFYKIGEAIGTQIVDRLQTAAEKVAEFSATLDRSSAKGASKKVADELAEVNAEIVAATDGWEGFVNQMMRGSAIGNLFYKDVDKLKEQQKRLNDELKGLSNRAIADEAKLKKDANDKVIDQLDKQNEQAMRSRMTDEQKVLAEAQDKIKAITAAFNALNAESKVAKEEETAAAIVAINDQAAEKIAKIRDDRQKEEERKAEEAQQRKYDEERALAESDEQAEAGRRRIAEEQQKRREEFEDFQAEQAARVRAQQEAADKVRKSWSDAYRAIREESNRAFATDQAASMVQLAAQMRLEGVTAAANMNQIVVQGVG